MAFYRYTIFLTFILSSGVVNAGSFRDFILAEDQDKQSSISLPASSKSAACMSCHNGKNASKVSLKHAESKMQFTSHGSSNHPVGMMYSDYARKNPSSYVSPTRLDKRITLENGQVTCVSCHSVKSHSASVSQASEQQTCTSTKSLTTGNSQTKLCMSCHAM